VANPVAVVAMLIPAKTGFWPSLLNVSTAIKIGWSDFPSYELEIIFTKLGTRSRIQNRKKMASLDCRLHLFSLYRIILTLDLAVTTPHSERLSRFPTLMLHQGHPHIYLLIRNFSLDLLSWRFIRILVASIELRSFLLQNTHSRLGE
jgi:hypothetical protein